MPILARILRDRGVVTERQLQEAIQHQVLYGGRLGTNLYELGFITEERLQEALSRAHGVPGLPVDPRVIQEDTVALVPRALAVRHKVFPYRLHGRTLTLLMVDPSDHTAVARIGYSAGFIVKTAVVPEFRMVQLLHDYYDVDEKWRFTDTHRPAPAAPPPPERAPGELLEAAETRDDVVEGAMALCLGYFRRVVFFIVREPWCVGWSGAGEGMDRAAAAGLKIPLDQPSVFQAAARDRTVFIGRLGKGEEDQRLLKVLSKKPGSNAAVLPIAVRGRVVNLIYGDNGAAGNLKGSMGELMAQLQKVPKAYLRIIRRRVAETRKKEQT